MKQNSKKKIGNSKIGNCLFGFIQMAAFETTQMCRWVSFHQYLDKTIWFRCRIEYYSEWTCGTMIMFMIRKCVKCSFSHAHCSLKCTAYILIKKKKKNQTNKRNWDNVYHIKPVAIALSCIIHLTFYQTLFRLISTKHFRKVLKWFAFLVKQLYMMNSIEFPKRFFFCAVF